MSECRRGVGGKKIVRGICEVEWERELENG